MKVHALKKLIKEAVKEAIREELSSIGTDQPKKVNTSPEESPSGKSEGINEMLNLTKQTMSNDDYRNVLNMNTSDVTGAPSPVISQGNQPGLDISNLDFVKKASAVYNLSNEKDKNKFG